MFLVEHTKKSSTEFSIKLKYGETKLAAIKLKKKAEICFQFSLNHIRFLGQ